MTRFRVNEDGKLVEKTKPPPKEPPPERKVFTVYDYFELKNYLIRNGVITDAEHQTFWHWWCDIEDGAMKRTIRYVPLGFWGWEDYADDEGDETESVQLSPEKYAAREGKEVEEDAATIFKVLVAFQPYGDKELGDLKVWVDW